MQAATYDVAERIAEKAREITEKSRARAFQLGKGNAVGRSLKQL